MPCRTHFVRLGQIRRAQSKARKASAQGEPETANPYKATSELHLVWKLAWLEASLAEARTRINELEDEARSRAEDDAGAGL